MKSRRGFTIVEVLLAMSLLVIGTVWAAEALTPVQTMTRTRRAMTNQQEAPRRAISEYVSTAGSLVIGTPVTASYDSVQVVASRITNTQLSTVPRVQFIISDQRVSAGVRPDTFSLDFHPLITGLGLPNLGDRRP